MDHAASVNCAREPDWERYYSGVSRHRKNHSGGQRPPTTRRFTASLPQHRPHLHHDQPRNHHLARSRRPPLRALALRSRGAAAQARRRRGRPHDRRLGLSPRLRRDGATVERRFPERPPTAAGGHAPVGAQAAQAGRNADRRVQPASSGTVATGSHARHDSDSARRRLRHPASPRA